jgi:GNAT superfamily N-acetyltransferase
MAMTARNTVSTSSISLRPARFDDAAALCGVQRRAIERGCSFGAEQRRVWMASISSEYLRYTLMHRRGVVCDAGDGPLGFGQLDLERARLTALYVEPAYMGCGVGDALLRAIVRLAELSGLESLNLQSTPNAAAFYRRRGFTGVTTCWLAIPDAPALEVLEMVRRLPKQR